MDSRKDTRYASADTGSWTWIVLGILLLLAVVIGAGSLALTSFTSQQQLATGSQTTPTSR